MVIERAFAVSASKGDTLISHAPSRLCVLEDAPPGWNAKFDAICAGHRNRLVRWVTAIFGPRDAEDIVQEALARLYVRPNLLAEDSDPWPWLSVVARNVGRDLARHNSYSTTIENAVFDRWPTGSGLHDVVAARQDAEILDRALMSLGPRDRALIRLRDLQEVAVHDIAATMRMNENAVRQQLFRARNRLAAAFMEMGGNPRPHPGTRSGAHELRVEHWCSCRDGRRPTRLSPPGSSGRGTNVRPRPNVNTCTRWPVWATGRSAPARSPAQLSGRCGACPRPETC